MVANGLLHLANLYLLQPQADPLRSISQSAAEESLILRVPLLVDQAVFSGQQKGFFIIISRPNLDIEFTSIGFLVQLPGDLLCIQPGEKLAQLIGIAPQPGLEQHLPGLCAPGCVAPQEQAHQRGENDHA